MAGAAGREAGLQGRQSQGLAGGLGPPGGARGNTDPRARGAGKKRRPRTRLAAAQANKNPGGVRASRAPGSTSRAKAPTAFKPARAGRAKAASGPVNVRGGGVRGRAGTVRPVAKPAGRSRRGR